MAVLTETHERVHVDFQHMQSTNSPGSLDAQILAPVSMIGAKTVTVTANLIAWKFAAGQTQVQELEVRLQQSSDGDNWFEVAPPSGNRLTQTISTVNPVFTNVGMAWARVVLIIDVDTSRTLQPGDGAIVKIDMTTS